MNFLDTSPDRIRAKEIQAVQMHAQQHAYGEPSGVGDADCRANCKHGMNLPPKDEL